MHSTACFEIWVEAPVIPCVGVETLQQEEKTAVAVRVHRYSVVRIGNWIHFCLQC